MGSPWRVAGVDSHQTSSPRRKPSIMREGRTAGFALDQPLDRDCRC
jgi:hypothetical protein